MPDENLTVALCSSAHEAPVLESANVSGILTAEKARLQKDVKP